MTHLGVPLGRTWRTFFVVQRHSVDVGEESGPSVLTSVLIWYAVVEDSAAWPRVDVYGISGLHRPSTTRSPTPTCRAGGLTKEPMRRARRRRSSCCGTAPARR